MHQHLEYSLTQCALQQLCALASLPFQALSLQSEHGSQAKSVSPCLFSHWLICNQPDLGKLAWQTMPCLRKWRNRLQHSSWATWLARSKKCKNLEHVSSLT